jgi:hypothetical protein
MSILSVEFLMKNGENRPEHAVLSVEAQDVSVGWPDAR